MKIQVLWDVTTCRLDSGVRNLRPEDRDTKLNLIGNYWSVAGHDIYKRRDK
jgi:hypothetical protein